MKAWSVMDSENECGYIVFAETRGKARAAAMRCAGLDLSEWNAIEVLRLPDLDGKRDAPCVLDWEKDGRIYYEAGWWMEGMEWKMTTYDENEKTAEEKLRPLLTDEFLSTLALAVKTCGHSVDHTECARFAEWCFELAEKDKPDLSAFDYAPAGAWLTLAFLSSP